MVCKTPALPSLVFAHLSVWLTLHAPVFNVERLLVQLVFNERSAAPTTPPPPRPPCKRRLQTCSTVRWTIGSVVQRTSGGRLVNLCLLVRSMLSNVFHRPPDPCPSVCARRGLYKHIRSSIPRFHPSRSYGGPDDWPSVEPKLMSADLLVVIQCTRSFRRVAVYSDKLPQQPLCQLFACCYCTKFTFHLLHTHTHTHVRAHTHTCAPHSRRHDWSRSLIVDVAAMSRRPF